MIHGDGSFPIPEGDEYVKLFEKVHTEMTDTDMMSKYHNLGTPGNVAIMNAIKGCAEELQATTDQATEGITGDGSPTLRFLETRPAPAVLSVASISVS